MEVVHHRTPSEVSAQVEGEDIISTMPEDVVTNIMNRLPLRDAVGTSAVTKFALFISNEIELDEEAIHHWVMSLSRIGGLKELTLINWCQTSVKLPTHLFSCLELKHLHLYDFVLSPSPKFQGFPKLISLKLQTVRFQDRRCGELIAQSPLLETLKISNYRHKIRGEMNLVEIAKLKNVKTLCLPL
uniref:uncharacterized protein LOC122597341 n=1 Tax=Erigeron canadensis TaxID=72917 RepID=UPI001CB9D1C8|nr:uncharacterized protein LOC122597341 [Erigeron canadensis]